MANTNYRACAMRAKDVPFCEALDAGSYVERYSERVNELLAGIKDSSHRAKVSETLGSFQAGSDGKLVQSSPYKLVILQNSLPEGNVLVSRPALQIAKENNPNFMNGFYIDCGLNLASASEGYETNKFLAQALASDLEKAGVGLQDSRLIPYSILTAKLSEKSPSGLIFELSEKGKDIAKSVVPKTHDFNWNYLPSKGGLFGAFLGRDGGWVAGVGALADSDYDGRVVVETTGEAGSRELEALKTEAGNLFARQEKERKDLASRLLA